MKFFERRKPLNTNENEMTDQQSLDIVRDVLFSDHDSKPGKQKRQMLNISRIDPALIETLKARAKARKMPLYEYCTKLLCLGMETEDIFNGPRRKSR